MSCPAQLAIGPECLDLESPLVRRVLVQGDDPSLGIVIIVGIGYGGAVRVVVVRAVATDCCIPTVEKGWGQRSMRGEPVVVIVIPADALEAASTIIIAPVS